MSKIVELLKKEASILLAATDTSAAPEVEEDWTQIKSAAVEALVESGLAREEAEAILSGLEKEASK